MPKVRANGIDIYYEITGTGEPLVLIAGLGYGLWEWHKVIPGLAEHFQVIAFDNRGAGGTDKPEGPYTAQMMGADTAGLLDALEISRTHVLGHSMGGFVAQELVLTRPDLVDKLILASTNFGGPNHVPVTPAALAVMMDRSGDPLDVIRRGIAVAAAPGFAEAHPDLVQELVAYRLTNPVPPAQYQAQMAVGLGLMSTEACFEHRLKGVKSPTLIFFGEHDQVVPPANAELLVGAIPNSTIQMLPDAGHIWMIEQPAAAVAEIASFLQADA
jgi:pimeloyl-ACP methyl ester carboxylesterase